MIRSIEQLFTEALKTRDFIYSKEFGESVVDLLVDNDWKDFSISKRDLVFQAMVIGFECVMKHEEPRAIIEREMKELKLGSRETVDLGQLYSFLDKERGTVALCILMSIFPPLYISEHINEVFPTLRTLAEKGLKIIKREVVDKKLSIVKKQMELVNELPVKIRSNEIEC